MSSPGSRCLALPAEADTLAFGAAAADALPGDDAPFVVYLEGDLGAGKTCLARALLQRLGVTGRIHSPSYGLMAQYEAAGWQVLHLDLYRLEDPAELALLGIRDLHAGRSLWLVEWPERGAGELPAPDLRLRLAFDADGAHTACLEPCSPRGQAWCDRLELMNLRQAADIS
ncbi:MAG: hypothetical protein RL026_1607 [Pseudomonadota bacterium]